MSSSNRSADSKESNKPELSTFEKALQSVDAKINEKNKNNVRLILTSLLKEEHTEDHLKSIIKIKIQKNHALKETCEQLVDIFFKAKKTHSELNDKDKPTSAYSEHCNRVKEKIEEIKGKKYSDTVKAISEDIVYDYSPESNIIQRAVEVISYLPHFKQIHTHYEQLLAEYKAFDFLPDDDAKKNAFPQVMNKGKEMLAIMDQEILKYEFGIYDYTDKLPIYPLKLCVLNMLLNDKFIVIAPVDNEIYDEWGKYQMAAYKDKTDPLKQLVYLSCKVRDAAYNIKETNALVDKIFQVAEYKTGVKIKSLSYFDHIFAALIVQVKNARDCGDVANRVRNGCVATNGLIHAIKDLSDYDRQNLNTTPAFKVFYPQIIKWLLESYAGKLQHANDISNPYMDQRIKAMKDAQECINMLGRLTASTSAVLNKEMLPEASVLMLEYLSTSNIDLVYEPAEKLLDQLDSQLVALKANATKTVVNRNDHRSSVHARLKNRLTARQESAPKASDEKKSSDLSEENAEYEKRMKANEEIFQAWAEEDAAELAELKKNLHVAKKAPPSRVVTKTAAPDAKQVAPQSAPKPNDKQTEQEKLFYQAGELLRKNKFVKAEEKYLAAHALASKVGDHFMAVACYTEQAEALMGQANALYDDIKYLVARKDPSFVKKTEEAKALFAKAQEKAQKAKSYLLDELKADKSDKEMLQLRFETIAPEVLDKINKELTISILLTYQKSAQAVKEIEAYNTKILERFKGRKQCLHQSYLQARTDFGPRWTRNKKPHHREYHERVAVNDMIKAIEQAQKLLQQISLEYIQTELHDFNLLCPPKSENQFALVVADQAALPVTFVAGLRELHAQRKEKRNRVPGVLRVDSAVATVAIEPPREERVKMPPRGSLAGLGLLSGRGDAKAIDNVPPAEFSFLGDAIRQLAEMRKK